MVGKKVAVDYLDWLLTSGEEREWGAKALVTSKMLQQVDEIKEVLGTKLGKVITEAIINNGHRARSIDIWAEWDPSIRATEFGAISDTAQGSHPIEYLSLAYHCWQAEQGERVAWENKSLLDYIKYWFKRTFTHGEDYQ